MTTDLSIIGIVFAIILFIIFFAAVILYLSFRIKETFREEKKRGMLVVKIAFLIGILFLAGGSFYFFAQILSPSTPLPPTPIPPSNGNGDTKPFQELLKIAVSMEEAYREIKKEINKLTIACHRQPLRGSCKLCSNLKIKSEPSGQR